MVSRGVYRFKVIGDHNLPTRGAAVLTCNHVSFIDPVLGWFFKLVKAIPMASRSEDPVLYEVAFEAAVKVLRGGVDAPVIPMALSNMWGSYFSRIEKGNAMTKPFRRGVFSRVGLNVGTALAPDRVQPGVLQARVATLQAA